VKDAYTPGERRRGGCLLSIWRLFIAVALTTFVAQLWVGFKGLPRVPREWLTGQDLEENVNPRYVVVLGGGGIPSESGLIRTYYGARFATSNPLPTFVVALPTDGDPEKSSVGRMRDELVMRGVPAEAILMEYRGLNTHFQAVECRKLLGDDALKMPVAIVTSPSHIRRAVMCFRKAGFERAYSCRADSVSAEADFGDHTNWRYGFWGNLEALVRYTREAVAIGYYKVRDWM